MFHCMRKTRPAERKKVTATTVAPVETLIVPTKNPEI